ncbi:MAG: type II toxin-antitoxin system RelE/ParE family toxin [Myxococcaceae bacterium]
MGRRHGTVRRRARSGGTQVVATSAFTSDLKAQIRWVESRHTVVWVQRLEQELESARDLLGAFPLAGVNVSDAGPVRKLLLRRLPFVIWYVVRDGRVILLRLFHVRQSSNDFA